MQDSIATHNTAPVAVPAQSSATQAEHEGFRDVQALEDRIVAGMNQKAQSGNTTAPASSSSHPRTVSQQGGKTLTVAAGDTTLATDTVREVRKGPVEGEIPSGVILVDENASHNLLTRMHPGGMSWIYGGLLLVFCIVALRFRNNKKYLSALFKSMTEVRERHNMFDDTVRETSFLTLLNLLWCCSAGVILYAAIYYMTMRGFDPFGIGKMTLTSPARAGVCIGVCAVYEIVMWFAYWLVGSVFSDGRKAGMWVKGFVSSQGIVGIVFFPLALMCLSYPVSLEGWLIASLVAFGIGKIVFLWKGFRIFFAQVSSWVLFLYYLCSLEIIPLIITYCGAAYLCRMVQ